jgi:hypothetical protein
MIRSTTSRAQLATDQPANWQRPHYRSGGGDAFLFYVVYGPVPTEFGISQSKYRVTGVPAGIELMGYGPNSHPELPRSFREGYVWDELRQNDAQLATLVEAQSQCLIIRGSIPDPADLNYFRNIVGLIQWLFDRGSIAVYDPLSFKWWDAQEWRHNAFDSDSGSPRHHVAILSSEMDNGEWLHTRGLRKFGRPDLSIHSVRRESRESIVDLLNRFIEFQAFGGVIDEGETIRVGSLPNGMTCHHRGSADDPDFNNSHVEIVWPC